MLPYIIYYTLANILGSRQRSTADSPGGSLCVVEFNRGFARFPGNAAISRDFLRKRRGFLCAEDDFLILFAFFCRRPEPMVSNTPNAVRGKGNIADNSEFLSDENLVYL